MNADAVLNDGSTVHVRELVPSDAVALQQFHARQSPESQYFRYFSAKRSLSDTEAAKFCRIDPGLRGALVVEDGDEMVAWASFERHPGRDDAEVAFHVDDAQSGRGIATLMLEYLGALARPVGVRRFTATVLADNRAMRVVFTHTGWPIEREFDGGIVDFTWPIDDTPEFVANTARREQVADSRSIARLLLASRVAAIGASDVGGSVGRVMFEHLLASSAGTEVFAVNPTHREILGYPCVASIEEIDADVALAVIAVPQAALATVLTQCAQRRVRGAVVLTEVSEDFPIAEAVAEARRYGMRIIGPGSMGFAHLADGHSLHAHLASTSLPGGPLAISLQAGSLGASVLERATKLGVGVSSFVSLGDKSDVSGNDLLQFWQDDAATRVIAMYTESFGNPRRFARIARRVALSRPIVAVRPVANPNVHDALYQQAGVIRVDTVAEMLDTARVLALQPLAMGRRIGIVTNSSSSVRLLASTLQSGDLVLVNEAGQDGKWQLLDWNVTPAKLATVAQARCSDGTCDAVIALYAPPVAHALNDVVEGFSADYSPHASVPLISVFLGVEDGPLWPGSPIPNFAFPDDAARVLARTIRYRMWRSAQTDQPTEEADRHPQLAQNSTLPIQNDPIRAAIDATLAQHPDGAELVLHSATALLTALGIPFAPTALVSTASEAVEAATKIGYPVVVKTLERHRRGQGRSAGVALELRSDEAVRQAWEELTSQSAEPNEVIVQTMVTPGINGRVHGRFEIGLGPVVSASLGGAFASRDEHGMRLVPLEHDAAAELVSTALAEQHVEDIGDAVESWTTAVDAVAAALDTYPEIAEIDINPLILSEDGCWATDFHVRIAPPQGVGSPMRHL